MRQLILKYQELESPDQGLIKKMEQPDFAQALSFIRRWQSGDQVFEFNTSGSTGQPKTIRLERWKMELSAQRTIGALALSENMTSLLCMSPQFIGGAMMIVRALVGRMNLIIVPPARQPFEHLTASFDFTAMVPMQLSELLKSGTPAQLQILQESRHILLGGAGIPDDLIDQIRPLSVSCWSTYGMTETVSHIALRKLNGGSPAKSFEVLDQIKIKTGNQGQLCIYDKITDDQWLETNDVVDLISENEFVWLGRLDNVINTGGVKVMAEKIEFGIEKALRELYPDSRYFVAGMPDDTFGTVVTLLLECTSHVDEEGLLKKLRKQSTLFKYEFPKRLLVLDAFPETPSGKIDKQQILKRHS